MCVLISEHSLLGVKGFIGAVLMLLGVQAGAWAPPRMFFVRVCKASDPLTPHSCQTL